MNDSERQSKLTRRAFLQAAASAAFTSGCSGSRPRRGGGLQRMIVLGVDGMDPALVKRFVAEGRLPHCKRLIETGSFQSLATTNPPQSPVAWSSFVSGTNPGGHGIFDFIAPDPQTMKPFHSTTQLVPAGGQIKLGNWNIPTIPGRIENLRHGPTFWNDLERHGVDCTVYRMPANFPPTETEATTLSGMGTPDLQGGYGIFTFYTDDPQARTRDVSGGRIERVVVKDDVATCPLAGPMNEFSAKGEQATVPIQVFRDPERPVAKIVVQDSAVVLREGEWSDWIVVRFSLLPWAVEVSGICRVYLQSVRKPFAMYVSPVNINPADPSAPISTPLDYSKQLVREFGYYYTQGMSEDTHALSSGVLSADEYRQQALFVHDERMRFFEHELGRFESGFLFFYFSTLDLSSHVFWRTIDPQHPLYSAELARTQGDFIATLYEKVDGAIGQVLQRLDPDTWLMVMSDHGFSSFRRQFNLNSWLLDEGYLRTRGAPVREGSSMFQNVAWDRTYAYGLGINSLYLNVVGREVSGRVKPGGDADRLANELVTRLQAVKDPETGEKVISHVYRAHEAYSGPYVDQAPDLVIGYNRHYRASWDTILGGFPRQHVLDNTDAWSGDHCVDPGFVPGILLSNRIIRTAEPRIEDLAPTILNAFGVPAAEGMTGRRLEV